jgi:hypothetical protein
MTAAGIIITGLKNKLRHEFQITNDSAFCRIGIGYEAVNEQSGIC